MSIWSFSFIAIVAITGLVIASIALHDARRATPGLTAGSTRQFLTGSKATGLQWSDSLVVPEDGGNVVHAPNGINFANANINRVSGRGGFSNQIDVFPESTLTDFESRDFIPTVVQSDDTSTELIGVDASATYVAVKSKSNSEVFVTLSGKISNNGGFNADGVAFQINNVPLPSGSVTYGSVPFITDTSAGNVGSLTGYYCVLDGVNLSFFKASNDTSLDTPFISPNGLFELNFTIQYTTPAIVTPSVTPTI